MDFSAYPTLTSEDRAQLAHRNGTLLILSPAGGATVYWPVGYECDLSSDRKLDRLAEFVAAAEAAGVVIVDASKCDFDAYVEHTIESSLPAIGHFADQKIAFASGRFGYASISDHARSYEAIGARVINADAEVVAQSTTRS